jgi:ABC-type branched-subunit amino acid transport system permease subunit
MAARGDAHAARRSAAVAGLVCGLAVAVAWGVTDAIYTVNGSLDTQYAILASVARLVIFPVLGYVAGGQGGRLWQADGAGVRRQRASASSAARGTRRSFRPGAGTLWAAVGLLLLVLFLPAPYSPIDAVKADTAAGRFAQFGGQALISWAVLLATGAAVGVAATGLRWLWPHLTPARRIVWQGILYALAIGGAGDRLRSRGLRRPLIAAGLAFVAFWPYLDEYILGAGTDARVSTLGDVGRYMILALGLNVVIGFAGLLDLGYVAFFAFGAYAWAMIGSAQLAQIVALVHRLDGVGTFSLQLPFGLNWAWWFWPGLLIGALVAAGFGVLLGAPTLRLRGDYLAIVTLGFGEIVPIVFLNIPKLSQGTNGLSGVSSPIVPGLAFPWFAATPFYYLMLVLIGVAIVCNIRLRDSRLGRAWVALREDEIATAASGVNTVRTKLLAFGTGAFFSGMAGVYHASKLGIIAPDNFSFGDSISYVAMVVLGGIGSIPGVMLGAAIIASLNLYVLIQLNVLRSDPTNFLYIFHSVDFALARNLIFGTLLVLMMLLRPEGLIPNVRRRAELHGEVAAETEGPVLDALDDPVGGPGYIEERVE